MRNKNTYAPRASLADSSRRVEAGSARIYGIGLILLAVSISSAAFAQGAVTNQIDAINKFAWSENSGWQNWRPTHTNVTVVKNGAAGYLSGYAWAENIGWVKMGATNGPYPYANTTATNYGVNMDANGNLSGYAWSETCGWINFSNTYSRVTINTNTGSFDGYAWGENVGWVHFKNASPAYNVRMIKTTALVTLTNLTQTYNGSARTVTATTTPTGLIVNITYDGNSWAPTNPGTYAVTGVVNDIFYQGSTNGTLTVNKTTATVTLNNLNQTYNGSARTVTATTTPTGLTVAITYDGNSWAPTNAGTYAVTGTVISAIYEGSTNRTLVVIKGDQTITNFPNPGAQITTNTVGLWAQASSGLPVTNFAVISGPGVISGLTNLTFTNSGSVSVTAGQPGDNNWNAAPTVMNTFNVTKATVVVTLHNLTQTYNGSARTVTATTVPAGLTVNITYDGNSWAPTNAGTYAVIGVVVPAMMYEGSANGTLTVAFPAPTASKGAYSDKVLVYWDVISAAISYKVWRGTNSNAQMASVLGTCTALFYLDISTTPDVLYYYWIQAVTASGVSGLSLPDSGYCGSIVNLTSPAGVQASDGGYPDRIRITWQTVSNATWYEVWRNTENDRSAANLISTQTGTSCDDLSVAQGIYYYYWLKARTANRDGNFSESDAGWRRLSTPARVSASNGAFPYHIRVVWNAVANAAWYDVWREEVPGHNSNGGNLTRVAQTGDMYFNDYYTKSGVYYEYKVKAGNGLGSSLDYGLDTGIRQVNTASTLLPVLNDYDGDQLSDLALFNSSSGILDVLCSALGRQTFSLGTERGQGVIGDYDGDGLADPVAYYPDSGIWLARLSSIGYNPIIQAVFGGNGNDPVAADFDGDGLTDIGVYNETNGVLSVIFSNGGAFDIRTSCLIGGPGYRFVSADFDGDGLSDPAVYSESEGRVTVMFSGNEYSSVNVMLGGSGRSMFAADFDGDGKADPVLYEKTTGIWIALLSSIEYGEARISFGGPGYVPAIGDYDGDGLADPAIYREADGQWQIMFSASRYSVIAETFGGPERQPVLE